MKFTTLVSRILGVIATLACLYFLVKSFSVFTLSWNWVFLFTWIVLISYLVIQGWNRADIEVGFKGQLLLLGSRLKIIMDEGKNWIPWPFGVKVADMRKVTKELDPVEIFTIDNIKVKIAKLSIVMQIDDLDTYHNVNPQDLNTLFDDIVDSNVREKIRKNSLQDVLGMSLGVDGTHISQDLTAFGIKIFKVVVPQVVPASDKTLQDLELKKGEQLQQEGQFVEAQHLGKLISFFKTDEGGKMNHDEAVRMAKLVTGKANAQNMTEYGFPPELLDGLGKILGSKK